MSKTQNIVEIDTDERIERAVASIFENRLPVFFPIKKLHQTRIEKIFLENNNEVEIEIPQGVLCIKHRLLTQNHKTFLEALLSYPKRINEDGQIYVRFKIYDLLKRKLKKRNPTDYRTARKYIMELEGIAFSIKPAGTDLELSFRLIDRYVIDNETGEYEVYFHWSLSQVWKKEHLLSYRKFLPIIENANSLVSQAIVRYLLTFSNLRIGVITLCEKLAFDTVLERAGFYKKAQEIRDSFNPENPKNDLPMYHALGLSYDEETDTISIQRPREVFFDAYRAEGKGAVETGLYDKLIEISQKS